MADSLHSWARVTTFLCSTSTLSPHQASPTHQLLTITIFRNPFTFITLYLPFTQQPIYKPSHHWYKPKSEQHGCNAGVAEVKSAGAGGGAAGGVDADDGGGVGGLPPAAARGAAP